MSFERHRCGKKPGVSKKRRAIKAHVKPVTSRSSSANLQICAFVVLFVRITAAREDCLNPENLNPLPPLSLSLLPLYRCRKSVSDFYARALFVFNRTNRNVRKLLKLQLQPRRCNRMRFIHEVRARARARHKIAYGIILRRPLKIYNIRSDLTRFVHRWKFSVSRVPYVRDSILLLSSRISRRPVDTLICKHVNRGPVRLAYAVNCALAALSSVLNSLLNDYINGSAHSPRSSNVSRAN